MKPSRKTVLKLPTFTEEEVLQFLRTQSEKGEAVRFKYLHLLLPKSIEYLRRISYLDRKDERYHLKLLKDRFEELIEALILSRLIRILEEAKLKYLVVTDLENANTKNPDSTIKSLVAPYANRSASTPTQTAPKALKSKNKAVAIMIPSVLLLFIFYSVLFAIFFETSYSLPISVLMKYQPWLAFYVFGFSAFFALISVGVVYAIVRAYSRKLGT